MIMPRLSNYSIMEKDTKHKSFRVTVSLRKPVHVEQAENLFDEKQEKGIYFVFKVDGRDMVSNLYIGINKNKSHNYLNSHISDENVKNHFVSFGHITIKMKDNSLPSELTDEDISNVHDVENALQIEMFKNLNKKFRNIDKIRNYRGSFHLYISLIGKSRYFEGFITNCNNDHHNLLFNDD